MAYNSLLLGEPVPQRVSHRLAETAVRLAGARALSRWRMRRTLTILTYHRFDWIDNAADRLDRQLRYLSQRFTPLPLSEAAEQLRLGIPLSERALCITVDDGHADFRDVAAPVLARYGIPATLFVTTDFVDGLDWLWFDQLEFALRSTQCTALAHPGNDQIMSLATTEDRRHCFGTLVQYAKQLPDPARRMLPRFVAHALEVAIPPSPPPEFAPVSWADLRKMPGVEVGVHTRSHPILACVHDSRQLEDEILGAARRIGEVMGRPPQTFCYPNGQPGDFNPAVLDLLRQGGFKAAVTTVRARVERGADLLQLPRIGVGPELPQAYFERLVSGLTT